MIIGLSICIACITLTIYEWDKERKRIKKDGWYYSNERPVTKIPPPPKVYEAPEQSLNMIRKLYGLPEIKKRYYIKQFYTMQELIDYLNRDKIKNEDIIKIEKEGKMWTLICQQ